MGYRNGAPTPVSGREQRGSDKGGVSLLGHWTLLFIVGQFSRLTL